MLYLSKKISKKNHVSLYRQFLVVSFNFPDFSPYDQCLHPSLSLASAGSQKFATLCRYVQIADILESKRNYPVTPGSAINRDGEAN